MPSLVLRSFLIVPTILLLVFLIYELVLRWKMSISPHRASYDAIAAKYLHDVPAKFEDDTWVDDIGLLAIFASGITSFFSGAHLFVLILEAWNGREIPVPLPKEWCEMLFFHLGMAVLSHTVAVYWSFVKNWNLSGHLKCTFNYKLRKMRCTATTTYCVLPELYPDLLCMEDLAIDCDRATTSEWLMVLDWISTSVVIAAFAWIELSRVRRYRADLQLTGKAKSLEAQDNCDKAKAEQVGDAVTISLRDKNEPKPKGAASKLRMAIYIFGAVYNMYATVRFVLRLFE